MTKEELENFQAFNEALDTVVATSQNYAKLVERSRTQLKVKPLLNELDKVLWEMFSEDKHLLVVYEQELKPRLLHIDNVLAGKGE
jgi:hypothetical protein